MSNNMDTRLLDNKEKKTLANLYGRVADIDDAFSTLMYELEIYDQVNVGDAVRQKDDISLVKTR